MDKATDVNVLIGHICDYNDMPVYEVTSPCRRADLVRIRDITCCVLNEMGYTAGEIAGGLNRDRSSVSYAIQRTEERKGLEDFASQWVRQRITLTIRHLSKRLLDQKEEELCQSEK